MQIRPISFGRTIKVNAPISVSKHAANLINSVQTIRGESDVQQQLKTLFYDSKEGRARAVAVDGNPNESYIVTGQASKDVSILIKDKNEQIAAAKKNYGECEMFNMVKDAENERFRDLLTLIIAENEEPIELNIDYSKRKNRIKSLNILI